MPTRPFLAPMIVCQDVDKSYEYFTEVLGFAGQGKMPNPDGSGTMHAEVTLPTRKGEAHLMLGPFEMNANNPEQGEFGQNLRNGPLGNGVVLYFDVPNVDKFYDFIKANGAIIDDPPKDWFWGDRVVSVRTPDGYYLSFATPIKGFKQPKEATEALTEVRPPTAPGTTKGITKRGGAMKAKAKARKATATKRRTTTKAKATRGKRTATRGRKARR